MHLVLRKSPVGDPHFFLWSSEPAPGLKGEQDTGSVLDNMGHGAHVPADTVQTASASSHVDKEWRQGNWQEERNTSKGELTAATSSYRQGKPDVLDLLCKQLVDFWTSQG